MATKPDPIAEAQRLEATGLSASEISRRLGRSRSWWATTRRRLGLPPVEREPVPVVTIVCRVSPEERERVHAQAREAGQSTSEWLRERAGLDNDMRESAEGGE